MTRLIIDLQGTEMTSEEEALLQEPLIGGVILFQHNIIDAEQVIELTQKIRSINPQLVIMVDQEGGRVQRLQQGFTQLPPVRQLGHYYDQQPQKALALAERWGWLLAAEVLASGVDITLAPVLDIDHGLSHVIGDRAFHSDYEVVRQLAHRFILGMQQAGMMSVGKHFPGHGGVDIDSHLAVPSDDRPFVKLMYQDFIPFHFMIDHSISALMPAHIQFPQIDRELVTFSRIWLKDILRGEFNYQGLIISDDIMMGAAKTQYPNTVERVNNAFNAGCNAVCLCHHRAEVLHVIDKLQPQLNLSKTNPLAPLKGRIKWDWSNLINNNNWQNTTLEISQFI